MYYAWEVQSLLYNSSCHLNDIRFPLAAKHTQQGNCYPKQILPPQTIRPFLWSRRTLSAWVGGMRTFFAHYRRRLPAGSLCSTITALWGCSTEAKERERAEAESMKISGGLVSVPTSLFSLFHSVRFGIEKILLCLWFFSTDVFQTLLERMEF